MGQLFDDPVMEQFRKDNRKRIAEHWASTHERYGLTLEDLRTVSGGEVAIAMIEPKPGEAASAVVADTTGHDQQAKAVLAKATATMLQQGAKESHRDVEGVNVAIFEFPPSKENQLPQDAGGQSPAPATATPPAPPPPDRTVYALVGNLLIASDNEAVAASILGHLAHGPKGSLAEVSGFKKVMERCAADAGSPRKHQVRWFVYPLGYAVAARAATPFEKRRQGKTTVEVIRNQGFGAIQGVGGFVDLAVDDYQVIHRTAVYAPKPYANSMKMLSFPNGRDFTPEPWAPRDVATYTTFYADVLNVFDNFGPMYDELFGEGEKGIWDQALEGMEKDVKGPHLNLRKELILNLGQRITMLTDYQLPITTSSERLLFAIEAKDEKAVAKAIEKCVKNDSAVQRRVIDGRVIWEIVEKEQPKVPSISISLGEGEGMKAGGSGKAGRRKGVPLDEMDENPPGGKEAPADDHAQHFLPHGAVTVAYGRLLIASHMDFLLKVLKSRPKGESLAENPEYKHTAAWVDKLGLPKHCVRQFTRTDESFRTTYELLRQGKMPESESLLGRTLNTMSGAAKSGVPRSQRIDGSHLPDFQVVRRSLGLSGMGAISEPDGWFFKGFMLPK